MNGWMEGPFASDIVGLLCAPLVFPRDWLAVMRVNRYWREAVIARVLKTTLKEPFDLRVLPLAKQCGFCAGDVGTPVYETLKRHAPVDFVQCYMLAQHYAVVSADYDAECRLIRVGRSVSPERAAALKRQMEKVCGFLSGKFMHPQSKGPLRDLHWLHMTTKYDANTYTAAREWYSHQYHSSTTAETKQRLHQQVERKEAEVEAAKKRIKL